MSLICSIWAVNEGDEFGYSVSKGGLPEDWLTPREILSVAKLLQWFFTLERKPKLNGIRDTWDFELWLSPESGGWFFSNNKVVAL